MPASVHSATTSPAAARATRPPARSRSLCSWTLTSSRARPPWRSSSTRVRRVSSQATTSASRSAASTRRVTSSRLPIGVGQTTSRPSAIDRSLTCEQRRAEHPGLVPEVRGLDAYGGRDRRQRAGRELVARRAEQQLARADHPTPDDDHLRIEDVGDAGQAHPEIAADERHRADRGLVAVVRQLGHQCAGDVASSGELAAERGVGRLARGTLALARERRAGGQRLQATVVRTVARAGRPVLVDDEMAELARRPVSSSQQPPGRDDRAADPGPEREHHRVCRALGRAGLVLGEQRRVRVVVDGDRQPDPLGHEVAHRRVAQVEVVGPHRGPAIAIHQRGNAHPDGLDGHVGDLHELAYDPLDRIQRAGPRRRAKGAMADDEVGVHHAREQLRPAEIDPDHALGGHGAHPTLRRMATGTRPPEPPESPPNYTKYRSRPQFLSRRGRAEGLEALRGKKPAPGTRRPITWGRVVKWVAIALATWIGISLIAFLISAQIESGKVSGEVDRFLAGGLPLTSKSTILVLGSDARVKGHAEPGANTIGAPSRSDSILLIRTGGGASARLSIPRDTVVDIPGHGRNKINAAYALGGSALAVQTIEQYLGIKVNHLVDVDFANFPKLIDAMGGIDYKGGCVVSRINGGFRNGGYTLRLPSGEHHISGKQALALARTRHNLCNQRENDLTRARRQQKIFSSMKHRVTSPWAFIRLPWVSWNAPRAIRSDMSGPSLLGLFGALGMSGSPPTRVLRPDGDVTLPDGGAGLSVSDAEKRREVRRFLRG